MDDDELNYDPNLFELVDEEEAGAGSMMDPEIMDAASGMEYPSDMRNYRNRDRGFHSLQAYGSSSAPSPYDLDDEEDPRVMQPVTGSDESPVAEITERTQPDSESCLSFLLLLFVSLNVPQAIAVPVYRLMPLSCLPCPPFVSRLLLLLLFKC